MLRIETLHETGGLPLEIGLSAAKDSPLPLGVTERARSSRLWHLIAWSDDESRTLGFWHKGRSIALALNETDGLSVEFMRRAKGPGWVALEARVRGKQAQVSLLQATSFNPDALAWLLLHQPKLSQVFGFDIAMHDRGSDY